MTLHHIKAVFHIKMLFILCLKVLTILMSLFIHVNELLLYNNLLIIAAIFLLLFSPPPLGHNLPSLPLSCIGLFLSKGRCSDLCQTAAWEARLWRENDGDNQRGSRVRHLPFPHSSFLQFLHLNFCPSLVHPTPSMLPSSLSFRSHVTEFIYLFTEIAAFLLSWLIVSRLMLDSAHDVVPGVFMGFVIVTCYMISFDFMLLSVLMGCVRFVFLDCCCPLFHRKSVIYIVPQKPFRNV